MLWEWRVMPQGLSNAPAMFNRLVTQLFRPLRTFAKTYFDNIFVHSRAKDGQTAMEVHLKHLRRVGLADPEVAKRPPEVVGLSQVPSRYSAEYTKLARPLSDLLKKDADWVWEYEHQDAFNSIKTSLHHAPVLALPDENKSFSVVCDASDYVIGFQAAKASKRNYPVHVKELLAMKYALVKFRVHLLGTRPFVIYTDHARPCGLPPARRLDVFADALSRRPEYELAHVSRVTTDLYDRIRLAYQSDENDTPLVLFLSDGKDAKVDRLSPRLVDPGDPPLVVVPNDEDLKYVILLEAHDAPMSGHLGREKTYQMVSQTLVAPHRVKSSDHASAPLQNLPVPVDCWKSMSLDFVFGRQADDKGNTCILVFVCRLSKMVHLAPVRDKVTGKQAAQLFLDSVFCYHGLPETIVSDRDPRFPGAF
ncbi:putative retroelement [Phytophthora palmivora]|uniref:Retroelement n=1 Tax=Phytophthora palmivora TaxID=4796 RepID=A0A2P4X9D8_9STRA|nr:putative retroelement [Phytophthora palmivora]